MPPCRRAGGHCRHRSSGEHHVRVRCASRDAEVALQAGQGVPGFTGGPVTAADGETVAIFVQDELLAADPTTPQRFADLLASLLHGSELSQLTLNLATLTASARSAAPARSAATARRRSRSSGSARTCARSRRGRSSPTSTVITSRTAGRTTPGRRSIGGRKSGVRPTRTSASGRKRASSSPATRAENYQLNPGEDFAENYRVLNERRLGVEELPWQVVDASLYPDQTALDLLAQDITNPWTSATSRTLRGTFGPARDRPRLPPPDAARRVVQRHPPGGLGQLPLHAPGRRLPDREPARVPRSVRPVTQSLSFQLCSQRSLQLQVKRVKGSGPFTLTVSQP